MKIGLIDADLLDNSTRFPNLALMKISSYYKNKGDNTELLFDYKNIEEYDKIFLSKVFSYTKIPINIDKYENIEYGGTGFYYDKAKFLPQEIEHSKPDYDLYIPYLKHIDANLSRSKWKYYQKYSIGFMSRGCFRKCEFCVNKRYNRAIKWSSLDEFYDKDKKYITLLDDNVLACRHWKNIFQELIDKDIRFEFKQGMDFRLLNKEKIKMLSKVKYHGDFIFAFDSIKDRDIIEKNLKLWNKYHNKRIKFYVLCGFDKNDKYDKEFFQKDIRQTFERIKILMQYGALPYIMRYTDGDEKPYNNSEYRGAYINFGRWCNQPSIFKSMSYDEMANRMQEQTKTDITCATMRYRNKIKEDMPNVADKYFDIKWEHYN